jgi:hypothetical protein
MIMMRITMTGGLGAGMRGGDKEEETMGGKSS